MNCNRTVQYSITVILYRKLNIIQGVTFQLLASHSFIFTHSCSIFASVLAANTIHSCEIHSTPTILRTRSPRYLIAANIHVDAVTHNAKYKFICYFIKKMSIEQNNDHERQRMLWEDVIISTVLNFQSLSKLSVPCTNQDLGVSYFYPISHIRNPSLSSAKQANQS